MNYTTITINPTLNPTLNPFFTQNKFVPHKIFVSDPLLPPPGDFLETSQRITF